MSRPTFAPRISSSALVVMVVPWAKNSIVSGAMPRAMKREMPSSTPSAGFFGVLATFSTSSSPVVGVEQHQVGVGAAHIDAQPVTGRSGPSR